MPKNTGVDFISTLSAREQFRDKYWTKKDPIIEDRLLWRAHSFRHLVHLLPGQTICELGCGKGLFTRQLLKVSKGQNPITAVTFQPQANFFEEADGQIESLSVTDLEVDLQEKTFNFIIAMDLLDKSNSPAFLRQVYKHLEPGGQIIFYESNPWNIFLRLSRVAHKIFGRKDRRQLASRPQLYEMFSQIGFIKIFSVFNDFVYAPLTPKGAWVLRNLSILLENLPVIKTLAGSILIHAQKPAQSVTSHPVSLCEHPMLKGKISVVVPCHNEEMNVIPLVERLISFYGEYLHEIVLVDDNSTDNTRDVIMELESKHQVVTPVYRTPPNGVGRAIKEGLEKATGEYILSMDCDFQHLLPELREMFDAATKGYDMVVGSRFSRYSVLLNYPFQKILANRAFHMLARMVLKQPIRDLTNNLKLFKREVVQNIELTQPGFSINAETGLLPIINGFSIVEVPISWINRTPEMGVSSFKLVKVGGGYWTVLKRVSKMRFRKRFTRSKVKSSSEFQAS